MCVSLCFTRAKSYLAQPDCGWHLAYFMTIDQMVSKVNNFAHSYDFPPHYRTAAWLHRCATEGIDVLNRETFVEAGVPAAIAAVLQGDPTLARMLQDPHQW